MINIPKGTKDVLPIESYKWQYVESAARKVAAKYNVKEIRTPVFEHTELFTRSIGSDTDVVSKEMYTFIDKGDRSITLKPEGTAPVARCFVENSLEQGGLPLKMFYLTPVFRYENPQHGRLREHHQFGVEVYGSPSPLMDAEVISLAYDFLSSLDIDGLSLNLNSIGCPECRKNYNAALKSFIGENLSQMCPTCRTRFENNPLRILDCKVDSCKKIVSKAPKIIDYICDDCRNHMASLTGALDNYGIKYTINPNIVRGLDYYTKTVFEFVTDFLGSQGTVCGGGRYDNMVESVGGKPTPCVGFGLGLERLIMLLEAKGLSTGAPDVPDIFIVCASKENTSDCLKIVAQLRQAGVKTETDFMDRSVKAQFKYADKTGAQYVAVIGGSELTAGFADIKKMSDGTVTKVALANIADFFKK